jgi:1-deoxy-D-xylulose-5-phosphate synthase
MLELARRAEEHMKGMVMPGTLFEEFGFNYIGPIDGHDLDVLVATLTNLRKLDGPQFLHVVTRKGKGYAAAEADPMPLPRGQQVRSGCRDRAEGRRQARLYPGIRRLAVRHGRAGRAADRHHPCDARRVRPGALFPGVPERYFDVGIAEQHALTFAAGLACEGLKPVVAIYSTFLQRAYDQLIHDICIQNLPVMLAIDRAGLVGADGPTHHGSFDLSYLRCLPNLTVMAASDENECRQMLYTAYQAEGPVAVRYPRGAGPGVLPQAGMAGLPLGKGEIRRKGAGIAVLAFGGVLHPALEAGETLGATVANMRFVKPIDRDLIRDLAADHEWLVTVEENVILGGAGSAVLEVLEQEGLRNRVLQLGLPDRFVDHGDPGLLLKECGLDAAGIVASIRARVAE